MVAAALRTPHGAGRVLAATALLCLAIAALPSDGAARTPHRAKFKVTVTGHDESSWSYDYPGGCHGQGTQAVRYATAKPVTVFARFAADGMPKLAPGALNGARFPVEATITRASTETGCRHEDVFTPPDCGTKRFSVLGSLRYLAKARLSFFTMAASVRAPFRNCPNFIGRVGSDDGVGVGLREARARLPQQALLGGRRRRFVVRGKGHFRDDRAFRAWTIGSSWEARFRRVL